MKTIYILNDIATGTLRVLDTIIIYSTFSDQTIRAIDIQSGDLIWISNQPFISLNQYYNNFLCNGNLSLYSIQTGELIYKSDTELWFSSLTFNNLMLFKQIIDETVFWVIFNSKDFSLIKLGKNLTGHGNAIYFDEEKIIFRKNNIDCFNFNGELLWSYPVVDQIYLGATTIFRNIVFLPINQDGLYALNANSGKIEWHTTNSIAAIDTDRGLVYSLLNHYITHDALTGKEVLRVENWIENQIEQYPALARMQGVPYISEDYLVFVGRTLTGDEGGVFFVDKTTAEIKNYFRIVFDKDPFQRKDWYGNKIPDDQQIPFIPLDNPIYKDGRLYVTLPSPIEGQKDLYVYEREE